MTTYHVSNLNFPDDDWEMICAEADASGLSRTSFARAVIVGAVRSGQGHRLAAEGAEHLPAAFVRAPSGTDPQIGWTQHTVPGSKAHQYRRGAFRLARVGAGGGPPEARVDGDGWWLTGPGLNAAHYCGRRKRQALEHANGIIARLDSGAL